jgi:uncharacterized protein YgbK (DUF1537 family)
MQEHLPSVFRSLAALGAPIAHYKVCSTLDSAPHIGSIGTAIDLAVPLLGGAWHPLLVAAPPIGRYQAFGNLFAVANGTVYRLDRHPTMSRHPVTPMDEADVRQHFGRRAIEEQHGRQAREGQDLHDRRRAGEIIAIPGDERASGQGIAWAGHDL